MYTLFWKSPGLPYIQKQNVITVGPGAVVSDKASIRFTGKGAANYGKIEQENLMRVLENFAGPTEPAHATVGQAWYDTTGSVLKVCVATETLTTPGTAPEWRALNATQIGDVGEPPPQNPVLGDTWFSRRGPLSGVLYVYTGVGRYPQVDWDSFGYYPSESTTLAVIPNTDSFSSAGTSPSEAYIHGFTSAVAADVSGTVLIDGSPVSVGPGTLYTRMPGENFIVWDESGTSLVSTAGAARFFSARRLENGQWQYDNNAQWVNFTPSTTLGSRTVAIGLITVAELDDNTLPGITSATVWSEGRHVAEFLPVPILEALGAIGGWAQVWPTVEAVGGRTEYDYVLGLVLNLIGDPTGFGGSGAYPRLINFLTPFNTLDASLRSRVGGEATLDTYTILEEEDLLDLYVDADSQDWDKLLAAARWALNRYELPVSMLNDISPIPFVKDGLPADPVTQVPVGSAFRAVTPRRAAARMGTASVLRYYQETVNVLNAAKQKRYTLKGLLGNSGTNTSFNPEVSATFHALFTYNAAAFPLLSAQTHGVKFRFANESLQTELTRFFTAGQAIEVVLAYTPGGVPTASDVEIANACTTRGRFRVTNDATYVMSTSPTPSLALTPGAVGVSSATSVSPTVLTNFAAGGTTMGLTAQLVPGAPHEINFNIQLQTSGATTGTLSVTWNWINDASTYIDQFAVLQRLYPAPLTYAAGTDKLGSANFV